MNRVDGSSGRGWQKARIGTLIALLVLMVALTACGADASQPAEAEVVSGLLDDWVDGWNTKNPDAVASVFIQDALYSDNNFSLEGRDAIRSHAVGFKDSVFNVWHGEVSQGEDGSFVAPAGFEYSGGSDAGEVEIRLEGRLIAEMNFTWRAVRD